VAAHIPAYQPKNTPDGFDPDQPRRLLLNSKEIQELTQKIKQANLTVIPISMYNNGKKIKLEIALARGKKKFDHRQSIKKKDIERDLGRRLKN
jgi:SsrA-binding protein